MKKQYKFIYYCPKCNSIVFKSNQYMTDGEIVCSKCDGDPIRFKELEIKVIHKIKLDKQNKKGLK